MVRENELQYWDPLSLDYMTEESDDESDPSRIIEHKLPWRSTGMIFTFFRPMCNVLADPLSTQRTDEISITKSISVNPNGSLKTM